MLLDQVKQLQLLNYKLKLKLLVVLLLPNLCIADGLESQNSSIVWDTNKNNVQKTSSLATVTTTSDQVVLTYTVTSGKTFFLQYFDVNCGLSVAPTNYNTPVVFGTISLETPSGTKVITWRFMGPLTSSLSKEFSEPIIIPSGVVIRVVTTPAITTSTTWTVNFGGYER